MERDGDGENLNFAGMVGRMAAGWWELCGCAGVVVLVCQGEGLQGCKVGRLQGCKYIDNQSVSLHLFCCGLIMV